MNTKKFTLLFICALFVLLFSASLTIPSHAQEIIPTQPPETSDGSPALSAGVSPSLSGTTTLTTTPSSGPGSYTLEQTLSDGAQRMTIAFDALGFTTGSLGADSFFPPGKVADFWGFQYLRDNDLSEMGHNTDFLTKASLNMYTQLTTAQRTQLVNLAKSQISSINAYGYKRFVLMTAFRRLLAGDLPTGTNGLDEDAIKTFSGELYRLDGQISYERAQVMGDILYNLSTSQKAFLDTYMVGKGMTSWPSVTEPDDMRTLSHDEKVAVMTYAGDLFSWYAGSLDADVYFCPERQGTYFGSFYLKDAKAINNPGYSIPTNLTSDMGQAYLNALTTDQAALINGLVSLQKPSLLNIVTVRTQVATELRKFKAGGTADSDTVLDLMQTYGELDGVIIYNYATRFASVGNSLSTAQKTTIANLRYEILGDLAPSGAFLYSTPIDLPTVEDTDYLFSTSSTPTCYNLTLAASPTAGGTPSASPTQSVGCSASGQYVAGESITLSAGASSAYTFSSWSGASVTNNVMTMPAAATTVTANYTIVEPCYPLTLTASPNTAGTVSATPSKSTGCTTNGTFKSGQVVKLTALPNLNYHFDRWSYALINATTNQMTVTSARAVTAFFGSNLVKGAYNDNYAGIDHSSDWLTQNSALYYAGTQHYTQSKTGSVIVNFTGTRLGMIYTAGRTYSKIAIKIDNNAPVTLSELATVNAYKKLWLSSLLPNGNHKAILTVLSTNPANTFVNFDGFLVDMTMAAR